MSSPITAFVIPSVNRDVSAGFIAEVFEGCDIAILGEIKFTYNKKNSNFKFATIQVSQWCDSEASYQFIQRLKCAKDGTRINYNNENYWMAKVIRAQKPLHWAKKLEKDFGTTEFPTCDMEIFKVKLVERRETDLCRELDCDKCFKTVTYRDIVISHKGDWICSECLTNAAQKSYGIGGIGYYFKYDKCTCHLDFEGDYDCKLCYGNNEVYIFTAYTSVN